ncbi:hypothetical protein BaRGS_00035866 [Batillaria attramentaria]|uniref:Secreted protein n=1 Tax=Batillaria attramentaria TaxID=370345 RepID=A0ABD0JDI7_9CAEN
MFISLLLAVSGCSLAVSLAASARDKLLYEVSRLHLRPCGKKSFAAQHGLSVPYAKELRVKSSPCQPGINSLLTSPDLHWVLAVAIRHDVSCKPYATVP